MQKQLKCFGMIALIVLPYAAAAQDKSAGVNSYAKGCMQIEDTLVCGAAEIAAAIAAALAAAQAAQAASKTKPKLCMCICGRVGGQQLVLKRMPEYECRATCAMEYFFPYNDYSCT